MIICFVFATAAVITTAAPERTGFRQFDPQPSLDAKFADCKGERQHGGSSLPLPANPLGGLYSLPSDPRFGDGDGNPLRQSRPRTPSAHSPPFKRDSSGAAVRRAVPPLQFFLGAPEKTIDVPANDSPNVVRRRLSVPPERIYSGPNQNVKDGPTGGDVHDIPKFRRHSVPPTQFYFGHGPMSGPLEDATNSVDGPLEDVTNSVDGPHDFTNFATMFPRRSSPRSRAASPVRRGFIDEVPPPPRRSSSPRRPSTARQASPVRQVSPVRPACAPSTPDARSIPSTPSSPSAPMTALREVGSEALRVFTGERSEGEEEEDDEGSQEDMSEGSQEDTPSESEPEVEGSPSWGERLGMFFRDAENDRDSTHGRNSHGRHQEGRHRSRSASPAHKKAASPASSMVKQFLGEVLGIGGSGDEGAENDGESQEKEEGSGGDRVSDGGDAEEEEDNDEDTGEEAEDGESERGTASEADSSPEPRRRSSRAALMRLLVEAAASGRYGERRRTGRGPRSRSQTASDASGSDEEEDEESPPRLRQLSKSAPLQRRRSASRVGSPGDFDSDQGVRTRLRSLSSDESDTWPNAPTRSRSRSCIEAPRSRPSSFRSRSKSEPPLPPARGRPQLKTRQVRDYIFEQNSKQDRLSRIQKKGTSGRSLPGSSDNVLCTASTKPQSPGSILTDQRFNFRIGLMPKFPFMPCITLTGSQVKKVTV